MKKIVLAVVILILVAGAGYLVFGFGRSKSSNAENSPKTALPKREDFRVSINSTGKIGPVKTVEVKSKASGAITRLCFEAGDYVQKGDLLCTIDQYQVKFDYDKAAADLSVAQVNQKVQEEDFKRQQELFERKLISESEMGTAELQMEQTRAQVIRAQAALSDAKQRLDDTVIRSPITGLIIKCGIEEGQIIASGVSNVSGGTLLMQIARTDSVYIVAEVDETDIGKVELGQKVEVEAEAYPGRRFFGEVLKIAPLATTQQNVTIFEVTTKVDNSEQKLKSGMNANIEIITESAQNALLVPNAAIKDPAKMGLGGEMFRREGGRGPRTGNPEMATRFGQRFQDREQKDKERKLVMVVENGELVPRPVVVGASNLDYTQILEGLSEADTIDITPISKLMEDREVFRQRMQRWSGVPGMKKN